MRMVHGLAMLAVFVALTAGAAAQTQITTASIEGVVIDASGGVLPGVDVEVRNTGTNVTRVLQTDREGRFTALQLQPGRYTVTFTLSGFATLVQDNVDVTVGQSLRLSPTMKPSNVTETVNVTAAPPTIDTSRTASASTLDETTIGTTPILGRKFEDLLTLTPGVSIVQGPDGDEINFSGQRGVFNNISLDGGDYNNGFFGEQVGGQRAAIDITLDAVKEFQVVATGANAEFGRTAGGVVNVDHEVGHQPDPRQPVLLPAPRGADVEHVRRQAAQRFPSRAVRRHARRPDREGPGSSTSAPSRASAKTCCGRTCRIRSARRARCRTRRSGPTRR